MSSALRNSTILISFIVFIYTLRQTEVSPGKLLRHQIVRFTQEHKISEQFCVKADVNKIYTETSKVKAAKVRADFDKFRGDSTLTSFINRGEPSNSFIGNYGKAMVPYLVPWIIFFVLGLLGFVYCLINWSCMNCWCCTNRGIKFCRRPKTDRFKNCYATFSIIFTVLAIGAGIAGIVFSTRIPLNANGTICSVTRMLEDINDGSSDDHWVGVTPALGNIDTIAGQINSTVEGLGFFTTTLNALQQDMTDATDILTTIYKNTKNITLNRADTEKGVYQPSYIQVTNNVLFLYIELIYRILALLKLWEVQSI